MSIELTKSYMLRHKTKSTLNNSAEFASKHMFDDNNETCWNSDQGSPQYIIVEFNKEVNITSISITFQGGFVGQDGNIEVGNDLNNMKSILLLETIDDINDTQNFQLNYSEYNKLFKITFDSSTDFYGRVTIYSLKIFGDVLRP